MNEFADLSEDAVDSFEMLYNQLFGNVDLLSDGSPTHSLN